MNFFDWIKARSDEVGRLEQTGREYLEKGDSEEYTRTMRRKAELLAGLADEADNYLPACSPAVRDFAEDTLRSFSGSARMALKLNSVFFMSALLYPDEHQPGEPNNLELFLEELEALK